MDTTIQKAFVAHQKGKLKEAESLYREVLKAQPTHPEINHNLGILLTNKNQSTAAIPLFKIAIEANPNIDQFWISYIDVFIKQNQLKEAEAICKKAIDLKSNFTEVYFKLGIILNSCGKLEEAEISYNKAIELKPDHAAAYYNLGNTLFNLGKLKETETSYRKAIELEPDLAAAHSNLGNVLKELDRLEEAEKNCKKAIELNPNYPAAYSNLGNVLKNLNKHDEAETSYNKAIELRPDYAEAHYNLGSLLYHLYRLDEAETNYKKAIELNPKFVKAYNSLGITLKDMDRLEEAEINYKKAIELKQDYAEAHYNLGDLQKILNKMDESLVSYGRAYTLKPDMDYLLGSLLHLKMFLCKWDNLSNNLNKITKKTNNGEKVSIPFSLLSCIDDPNISMKSAEIYSNHRFPKTNILPKISHYHNHEKIRIGYFSPDFNNHPVSYLSAGLYETHDRNKFEVHAFSFGVDKKDEFNLRIKEAVDHFHDVRKMSDQEITKFARSLELDIAIDLTGFTGGARPGIFSLLAAPIQIGYIGYLGTMGTDFMNYLIADKTIIPERNKKYYSENIVYLPSYQVNDSKNYAQDIDYNKEDFYISDEVFVFCCFNNTYKITPNIFNCWIRILEQVDNSVLMLFAENETAINNLKTQIDNRGIDSNRLIFGKQLIRPQYLARYKIVDLFLDTLPYNGGTIVSDALRMGVPVITCTGESFASRMAASILKAVNLPELITSTYDEYESLAIDLAIYPEKLKIIKDKLINNLPTATLYDTSLFTRHLETAYQIMYERYQKGLNLDDIEINF